MKSEIGVLGYVGERCFGGWCLFSCLVLPLYKAIFVFCGVLVVLDGS